MGRRKTKQCGIFLLATCLALILPAWLSASVFAQSTPEDTRGIVRVETDQGFAYMTGGVGIDERQRMEKWAQDYNLKLSFAEQSGVYLADVGVVVEDQSGEEIINMMSGPWLYLQLPPDTYTVKATFKDETRQVKNLLVGNGKRVARVMRWDLPQKFPIYASMKQN